MQIEQLPKIELYFLGLFISESYFLNVQKLYLS